MRERIGAAVAFGGLALLPDADVAGVSLGFATDQSFYGHRGYSHSLLFAVVVALGAWAVARRWGTRPALTGLLAFLAVASHGILDAMTWRTRGIAFFWPLTEMRIAFPWRPIPPAPTGVAFVSHRGLEVAAVELVYFLPLALLSFAPSVARLQRWGARFVALFRARSPETIVALSRPLPVAVFSTRRAAFQLGGIVAAVAATLALAQVYLRESRVVAWIEQSTHESVAVSMGRRPAHRHPRQVR